MADGIDSEICLDAETALGRLSAAQFDLLVLDINLPGMDGFEFLAEFKRDVANASIPVVVISAKDLTSQERDRIQESAADIMQKSDNAMEDVPRTGADVSCEEERGDRSREP